MKLKQASRFVWAVLAVGFLAVAVPADSIPVSGSESARGALENVFFLAGQGIDVEWISPDATDFFLVCNLGSFCALALELGSAGVDNGFMTGSFKGAEATDIEGGLLFTGGAFMPATGVDTFTFPVTVTGDIAGEDLSSGRTLWTLNISATGTATFSNSQVINPGVTEVFSGMDVDFTGAATPTPEPPTLLMLGAGLLGLGISPRRRQ